MNPLTISRYLFFFGILLFFMGEFFSRAILSISPVVLLIAACTHPDFKENVKHVFKERIVTLAFILYFIGFICFPLADNKSKWAELLFKNLPYLVFPFSLVLLKDFVTKYYKFILYTLILFVSFISISTFIRFVNNYELYTWMIRHSKNIEATGGMFHIHFGLMTALAIIFCYAFIRFSRVHILEKFILGTIAIFLFIALHVLAYRTGIVSIYICILSEIVLTILYGKKYILGICLLIVTITVPLISYYSFRSVQERVQNTKFDILRYKQGKDINYYSLSQRFAAWETAFGIYKKNWLFGISAADLQDEMSKQYAIKDFGLKKENQVLIHNQYFFYAVCYGIIGLGFLLYMLAYCLALAWRKKNPIYLQFVVLFSAAFMIDTLLEMQTGQNMFIFFYSILPLIPLSVRK